MRARAARIGIAHRYAVKAARGCPRLASAGSAGRRDFLYGGNRADRACRAPRPSHPATRRSMQWSDDALVLDLRRHGETGVILEAMTEGHGRHLGLVHGGRSRRMQPVLQPGNRVRLTWRARLDEGLGSYAVEPLESRVSPPIGSKPGPYGMEPSGRPAAAPARARPAFGPLRGRRDPGRALGRSGHAPSPDGALRAGDPGGTRLRPRPDGLCGHRRQ